MEDLIRLIRADAKEVEMRFDSASIQGRGTPQDISDFRENALQEFLANYYPFPYRIAKGGILDHTGKRSASIDCILINPDHPYTIDRREKFRVILCDGVDAAIEVKPDLSQTSELHRGLEQGLSVSALRRSKSPLPLTPPANQVERSLRTPYFLFAMKAKKNILDTASEVFNFYRQRGTPTMDQADAIIVNGEGILANFKLPGSMYWGAYNMPDSGWFFECWQDDTLAGLLFKLNNAVAARLPLQAPILKAYLRSLKLKKLVPLGKPVSK